MAKKILKTLKKSEPRTLINIKVNKKEKSEILKKAKKFASGNVSEWIRYASQNMEPNQEDLA